MDNTKRYDSTEFQNEYMSETLSEVMEALEEKGYNAVNQIVGYLMSGDPGYISNYKESRSKLIVFDRTKILEFLVSNFAKEK